MNNGLQEADIYLYEIKNVEIYRGIYSKIGTLPMKPLNEESYINYFVMQEFI
jgi:hypothetical protein